MTTKKVRAMTEHEQSVVNGTVLAVPVGSETDVDREARKGTPKRPSRTPLTGNALHVMAAVMGISNLGMDNLFRGRDPRTTPERLARTYRGAANVTVTSVAWSFASWFCEDDEMGQMAVDECESWLKTLRKMSVEEFCRTWPYYSEYVEALTAETT
jgi:hypothetical protein